MNNFEKIYVDGVPTEKYVKIEKDNEYKTYCGTLPDFPISLRSTQSPIEMEKPIADTKNNGRRAVKKGSKRSNKV